MQVCDDAFNFFYSFFHSVFFCLADTTMELNMEPSLDVEQKEKIRERRELDENRKGKLGEKIIEIR